MERDPSSAQATVLPPRHARTARAAAVRRPSASGSSADDGQRRAVAVDERDRIGISQRALGGAELQRGCSGGDGDEVGADGPGAAGE